MGEQLKELIAFVNFINKFRAIERTIWFSGVEGPERDGEHSYQVAMVAWFMNARFALGLNTERLIMYTLVHDLVEVYAGDTPAFPDLFGYVQVQKLTHADKKERERLARTRIFQEWEAQFPEMIEAMQEYERQKDEESCFVYAMEKLLAEINIFQDEGKTWKRLCLSLRKVDAYKRPRVAKHLYVKALYEELQVLLRERPELFSIR